MGRTAAFGSPVQYVEVSLGQQRAKRAGKRAGVGGGRRQQRVTQIGGEGVQQQTAQKKT